MYKIEYLLKLLGIEATITSSAKENIFDAKTYDYLGFYTRFHDVRRNQECLAKVLVDTQIDVKTISEVYRFLPIGSSVRNTVEHLLEARGLPAPYNVYQSFEPTTGEADPNGVYYDLTSPFHTPEMLESFGLSRDFASVPYHNVVIRFNSQGEVIAYYHNFLVDTQKTDEVINHPMIADIIDSKRLGDALSVLKTKAPKNSTTCALGLQIAKDASTVSKFVVRFQ